MSATPAEWEAIETYRPDDPTDGWDYENLGPHPLDLEELGNEDDDLYSSLMEDFDSAYKKLWGDAA